MPDIVSRIRVEAQGADQAAREIRKLKDAYDQVAASAKNLSPAGVGGVDPFTKATSSNTGVMAGGQSTADVAERETRNRRYQEQVRDREGSNNSYNQSLRGAPGAVGQFAQTAEAAGSGRGGAALGGGLGMLGSMLAGPVGIAALVAGAAAMGVQKFAETSFQRMENVYGGGISQRLGATYADTQNYMTEIERTGVPRGMVNALMVAASGSGAQFTPGTANQFGMMADVAAGTGVDPGILGALLGSTQRAGLTMNYGTMAGGAGAFGRGSLGTFFTEMNRTIEGAMTSGIAMSQEQLNQRGNMLSALAEFGGLSPTGAVALNQRVIGQGQQMAQLQSPESIIAFQAMRVPGESISDTQRRMEENPIEANKAIISYLQRSTGGNDDVFRARINRQFGGGLTQGQIDALIATGTMDISTVAGEGITPGGVYGKVLNPETGEYEDFDVARKTIAVRQIEMLKGVQDAALELTSMLGEFGMWLRGASFTTRATDIGFGGIRKDLLEKGRTDLTQVIDTVNDITVQNVDNLVLEVDEANLTVKQLDVLKSALGTEGLAANWSTIRSLRENPALQSQISTIFDATPGWGSDWEELKAGGFKALGSGVGGFDFFFSSLLAAVESGVKRESVEGLRGREKREERREASEVLAPILQTFFNQSFATETQFTAAVERLMEMLSEAGIVYTDGGIELSTRQN